MKKGSYPRLLCLVLLLGAAAACEKKQASPELPVMARLEIYGYNPYLRLEGRLGQMPAILLEQYRLMDGRPDYKSYNPSPAEKALFLQYLRLMPPAVERIFMARCVGVYFVEGFMGNGLTSWVADSKGKTYFHMTLNPAAFRQTLTETLTERERSCFIPARGWTISVDAGSEYKGLAYAVFHEAAHAVDYMAGVTPLVDPDLPERYRPPARPDGGFFTKTWASHSAPSPGYDYPYRDKLTFYGLGGGPKIPLAEAPGIYNSLIGGPFASLYGSKSWAEDLAELTAYGLIVRRLGQPYRITVAGPAGKTVSEPMEGRAGRRAEAILQLLEKI
ncbi:MAG: hypothetical protein Q7R35_15105 [Elusimicrobiota bacterium]|nr:hypothetical protein [Elusimicrobiota bacterium]